MSDPRLTEHALSLLRANPEMLEDARKFWRVDNTIVGSVMNLTLRAPRWAIEQAVRDAVKTIDARARKPGRQGRNNP